MKQLIVKYVIPLTIISFAVVTKWWYVQVIDGTDEVLTGFPLPFTCRGFHTSGSRQFFMAELGVDVLTYFSFWLLVVFCSYRFTRKLQAGRIITVALFTVSGLIIIGAALTAFLPGNVFKMKRDFEIEVMDSGYQLTWQEPGRPDFYKYRPRK